MAKAPIIAQYKKVGLLIRGVATYFVVVIFLLLTVVTWFPTGVNWQGARILSIWGGASLALMFGVEKLVMWIWKLRLRRVMRINKRIADAKRDLVHFAEAMEVIGRGRLVRVNEGDLILFGQDAQEAWRVAGIETGRIGGEFLIRLIHPMVETNPQLTDPGPLLDHRGRLRQVTAPPHPPPNQRIEDPTQAEMNELHDEANLTQRVLDFELDDIGAIHEQANDMNALRDGVPADIRRRVHDDVAAALEHGWGTMEEAVVGDYMLVNKERTDDGHYVMLPDDERYVARVTAVRPGPAPGLTIDARGTRGLPVQWTRVEMRQPIGRLGDHRHVVVGTIIHIGDEAFRIKEIVNDAEAILEPVNEQPDRIVKRTMNLQVDYKIAGVEDGRLIRRPAGAHRVLTKPEPTTGGTNEQEGQEGNQTEQGNIRGNAETQVIRGQRAEDFDGEEGDFTGVIGGDGVTPG